ncbi:MAG: hypothetical protein KY460_02805 [Actinobacteria bacterium]|nr:hypothetical protein [Actinomycetota bacterium]
METLFSLTVLSLPLLARGLAEAVQRRMRRSAWSGHDASESLDAVRGYKIAQLIVGPDDDAWLAGVTSLRYRVDALARCRRRGCVPPGLDCRCGFYAFRDRARAVELLTKLTARHPARSYVLLTADLDGDVLEYEFGYRAQRQRILRIEMQGACTRCLRDGQHTPAVAFASHAQFRGEQLLYERTLSARVALPMGSAPVRSVCGAHLPAEGGRTFDLARLRGVTGTEVTLLPATGLQPPGGAAAA